MINAISDATRYFCSDVLGFELKDGARLGKDLYGSSIPVFRGKDEYNFYLYFKKDTLIEFAKVLLNSKKLENIDLADLSREVANQIVGHAKSGLEKIDPSLKLGVPEFLGKVEVFNIKLDSYKLFKMKNRTFQIGYKKV